MVETSFKPYKYISGDRSKGLLLICDHAVRAIPQEYKGLGVSPQQMQRHIAYDIGAEAVILGLQKILDVPAVMTTYSRLLIDPNRGFDDPTLVMRLSDGALIPGNAYIDTQEIEKRRKLYYQPYHDFMEEELLKIERERAGKAAAIFSIHSFTPIWRGIQRRWEATILWDSDPRMPKLIMEELNSRPHIKSGENVPYDGALLNDCLYQHGTSKGRAHALLELRQDLIDNQRGVDNWVSIFAEILESILDHPCFENHEFYPSRAKV